jgi:hypothetical protein
MARYEFDVEVLGTTVLQDVQNISIQRGRQQVQDPFKAATATVEGLNPNLLTSLQIGDKIEITCPSPTFVAMFYGFISDIKINYGFVPNEDVWTIYCEDYLAVGGRALTPTTGVINGGDTANAANFIGFQSGVNVLSLGSTTTTTSVQTVSNQNLLSVLQQLAFTEQGRLYGRENDIYFGTRNEVGTFNVGSFTDGSLVAANAPIPFNRMEFYSQADSYFTQAVVEPEGLASQSAGTGNRVFSGSSYNSTTSAALDLANYVLATLQVNQDFPQTISCISENQINDAALIMAATAGEGIQGEAILRGSRYPIFIEGSTLTASPEETFFTFNVVSTEANNFFILDSSTFGILGTNRLGL